MLKKIVICLLLSFLCLNVYASDCEIPEDICEMTWPMIVSDYFEYCHFDVYEDDPYLCRKTALEVIADIAYNCWLD